MTTEQQESGNRTHSPPSSLSCECRGQLAILIANLIETHLNIQAAELDNELANQVHSSSSCLDAHIVSIKEDYHAHCRSTSVQNH